jgi:hypothetical protein
VGYQVGLRGFTFHLHLFVFLDLGGIVWQKTFSLLKNVFSVGAAAGVSTGRVSREVERRIRKGGSIDPIGL